MNSEKKYLLSIPVKKRHKTGPIQSSRRTADEILCHWLETYTRRNVRNVTCDENYEAFFDGDIAELIATQIIILSHSFPECLCFYEDLYLDYFRS